MSGAALAILYMRNPFCLRYDDCLAIAAKQDLEFDCFHCNMIQNSIEISDIRGCHLLLMALFSTDLYKKFRELPTDIQSDAIG